MKRTQMRDTIKDIKYFNTFINEEQARVKKFSDKLKNGEVKEDRIFPVKSKMHDLKLGILIAGYSKGDELSILEKEYQGLIDDWEEVWEPEYYNKNLKMISLGILFQADSAFAQKVKNMLKSSNINDWLYDFLLDSWDGEQTEASKEMLFPNNFLHYRR
ncbi:MAG: PoNe immunity protein domain-containing protein [Lachnospiraceae bacterium]